MPDPTDRTPIPDQSELGNDMSDRSTWTGESESGNTDTPVGHPDATWAEDEDSSEGVPTMEEAGRSGEHETGTTFGADPGDDHPQ